MTGRPGGATQLAIRNSRPEAGELELERLRRKGIRKRLPEAGPPRQRKDRPLLPEKSSLQEAFGHLIGTPVRATGISRTMLRLPEKTRFVGCWPLVSW